MADILGWVVGFDVAMCAQCGRYVKRKMRTLRASCGRADSPQLTEGLGKGLLGRLKRKVIPVWLPERRP